MKKNKTFLEKIESTIPDPFKHLFEIAANVVTVAGFFGAVGGITATGFSWESGKYSQSESWKSYMVLFLSILILLIIVFLWINRKQNVEHKKELQEERKTVSHKYAMLMSECKNKINEIEKKYKTDTLNMEYLTETVKAFLQNAVEYLVETLEEMTEQKVCACIKIFPYGYGEHGQISDKEARIRTFIRSRNTARERMQLDDTNSRGVLLTENTDFAAIIVEDRKENYHYFYQSNLKKYAEQLREVGQRYRNSTENWDDFYIGTIVFPIRIDSEKLWYLENPSTYYTLGFLCVDSKSEVAFPKKREDAEEYLNIMTTYADAIFNILAKYQYYLKQLDKEERDKGNNSYKNTNI